MLITPSAAARFWTHRIHKMVLLAAALGMIAGLVGSFISYLAPAMPTGPWIVLSSSLVAYGSFLMAPQKGLLARKIQQGKHQRRTLHENILKLFYELSEADGHGHQCRTLAILLQHRPMPASKLLRGLKRLQKQDMLQREDDGWVLTTTGSKKGEAISQRHRLWELYLTHYVSVKPDHVHEEADAIEHIIPPALTEELDNLVALHKKEA